MPAMDFSYYGPASIADSLGDFVAYRSLRPQDSRIRWTPPPRLPRKIDPAYGTIVLDLLHAARAVARPSVPIKRVLVIGDNLGTDGEMLSNMRQLLDGQAQGIIVDEDALPPLLQPEREGLVLTNSWRLLDEWLDQIGGSDRLDEQTAVVLDIDKTMLGARGRNATCIDDARRAAMELTIRTIVGERWEQTIFDTASKTFNQGQFHAFTGDNQDYVAVLCLVVGGNVLSLSELVQAIEAGRFADVAHLLQVVLQQPLHDARLHDTLSAIADRVACNDPTPFKQFRTCEYEQTIARMNVAAHPTHTSTLDISQQLRTEICLTGEVLNLVERCRNTAALIFALSDKPDEAALPEPALATAGYRPLHHAPTHIVCGTRG